MRRGFLDVPQRHADVERGGDERVPENVRVDSLGKRGTAGDPVGAVLGRSPPVRSQALHWNGRKWSLVATPDPGGTRVSPENTLSGLACSSSASCWAVGRYGPVPGSTGAVLNQALRWNGRKWSLVATPDPGGTASGDANITNRIRCTSPASCWSVGEHQASGGVFLNQ